MEYACRKVVPYTSITGHFILYICSLNVHTHIVTLWDVLVADHLQSRNSLTSIHCAEIAAPPCDRCPLNQSHETQGLASVVISARKRAAHTRTQDTRVLGIKCCLVLTKRWNNERCGGECVMTSS